MDPMKSRVPDSLVVVSGSGWIVSHLAQINTVVQILAGLATFVAMCFAIRYHRAKTRALMDIGQDSGV